MHVSTLPSVGRPPFPEDLAKFARLINAYAYAHAAARTFQSANLE